MLNLFLSHRDQRRADMAKPEILLFGDSHVYAV